jgi:hypothetical protein
VRTTRILTIVLLLTLTACQYYEDFRMKKATADLRDEQAELLHAYRECLVKYQDTPAKSKEYCAPYTQSLREIDVRHETVR